MAATNLTLTKKIIKCCQVHYFEACTLFDWCQSELMNCATTISGNAVERYVLGLKGAEHKAGLGPII